MFDRKFHLPPPQRPAPWWTLASVVAHVALVAILAIMVGSEYVERRRVTFISLSLESVEPREVPLPPLTETPPPPAPAQPETPQTVSQPRVRAQPDEPARPLAITEVPREVPVGISAERDSAMIIGTRRQVGPAYARGRVWVQPLEVELGVVGASPSSAAHVARVDSALRERILAFIDSMPADSFAVAGVPEWKAEVGDQTWGVDSKWIYLGDFKLPAALLALLPFPQGNYYEAKYEQELLRVREDIIRAARAAENAEDFRHYVEEVRKRKQAEREAERARREATRDTVIP